MKKDEQLHKYRVVYASQCYSKTKLKCPVCLLDKIPRHCKIYKSPAALYWHIKTEHGEFVFKEFGTDDIICALNGVTRAIQWGMLL